MHPADALTERLGLPIRDRDLLAQALVHSSWLHEHPDAARGHNERLEFLGDAVVNLAVSEALYRRHPSDDEGVLSARRAAIVSTPGLARLAARLGLGDFLFLGEGEAQRGGRVRPSLLASAFEALVGAIYLDLGWDAAKGWIHQWAAEELSADLAVTTLKSPKSRLQEHTQRTTGDRPVYRLVEAVGPDHEKQFRIEVVVDGRTLGVGEGPSRRIAETSAAAEALEAIRVERQLARAARSGGSGGHPAVTPARTDGNDPADWPDLAGGHSTDGRDPFATPLVAAHEHAGPMAPGDVVGLQGDPALDATSVQDPVATPGANPDATSGQDTDAGTDPLAAGS